MTLVATRPEPGDARPYTFPGIQRLSVAGGEVVAAHMPGQLLATATLLLDAGAAYETIGREGTAAVLAKSLEEGTATRDSTAYALALEGLGAELSASVDWEAFRTGVSVPVGLLPRAVALLAEATRTPRLDPADVERVRDDEATALRMDWAQPGPQADAALRVSLFEPGERYGRPLHGDPESMAAVTVEDVTAFHEAYLKRPGVLLVAGDLDKLDLRELGEAAFAGTSGAPLPAEGPLDVPVSPARRLILLDRPGSVQSTLRLGHRAPERGHPDYVPITLAATVLGGAFTSRLNHLIREVKGYTYGIRADFAMSRRFGRFGVSSSVQTAVTAPALTDTVGEITRTQQHGVTEEELTVARTWRAGSLSVDMQTPGSIAGALATLVIHGLPDDYYATLRRQLLEATAEQVSAAAAEHLHPEGLTIVVEGDAASIREELVAAKLGELL
ncbi:M16 family metallopeptidase [Actinoplanes sp. RD1]|uniref:M16 family metallopeptidase n=1 Tax=Actinoplanes sp. RD1 TaxID=3064538 RepID=UPI0027409A82|nr:pitrilysin family protein [Actinoplanes sp. RD1]